MPEKMDLLLTCTLAAALGLATMPEASVAATPHRQAQQRYGTCAPKAYNNPPMAGPTIDAVWLAELDQAMACGTLALSTSPGTRAWVEGLSNARHAPSAATAQKIPDGCNRCNRLVIARSPSVSASRTWQMLMMVLRLKRSATWPTTSVNSSMGRNCASPTMPSANVLWVSA